MHEAMQERTRGFQRRLKDDGVDVAIVTDEDSIAWFAGYWGYLGVEFGRPTMLVVPADGSPSVITPLMESDMAGAMTWIDDVRPWQDAPGPEHWDQVLASTVKPLPGLISGWSGSAVDSAMHSSRCLRARSRWMLITKA